MNNVSEEKDCIDEYSDIKVYLLCGFVCLTLLQLYPSYYHNGYMLVRILGTHSVQNFIPVSKLTTCNEVMFAY